jgi:hypothetical protein
MTPERSSWANSLLYLIAFAFLCLRTPFQLIHGYVEGEEGTVYLRYAWDSPVWRSLLAPHQGYYSLFANLCGILAARVLPLEQAGHFYVLAQIAIGMLLVYMLLQCECLHTTGEKALALAVVLLVPSTASIVLCTVNAQFFLALVAGIILISDANRLRTLHIVVLAFCSLNGVLSSILLPLFAIRAWRERTTARKLQFTALLAGTLIQAIAILLSGANAGHHQPLATMAGTLLFNGFIYPFLGSKMMAEACKVSGSPKLGHLVGLWWLLIEIATFLYLAAIVFLTWTRGHAVRLLGLAAVLSLVPTLARGADIMCGGGGRYFYLFIAFLGLALVLIAVRSPKINLSYLLIAGLMVSGAVDVANLRNSVGTTGLPIWSQEVAAWRQDPQHPLRIEQSYWIGVKLTPQPGNRILPANIYDSTVPGWRDR